MNNTNIFYKNKIVNPFWVKFDQKNQNKKDITKSWIKFALKWIKLLIYLFLTVIGLWGCFQIIFDHTVSSPSVLGAGLEIGFAYGTHNYIFDCQSNQGISGYAYYTFDDFTLNYGPFYGFFVWPFSKLVMFLMWGMRGMGGGTNTIFSLIVLLLIIRSITILISIRSILASERMSELQGKMAEINAKYKGVKDMVSKQRRQAEISALYKQNNVSPFAIFEQMFVTLPITLVVYRIVTLTRPIKATILFNVWDLSAQPFDQILHNFTGGGWVYVFFLLIVIPTQILQQFLMLILAKKRNRRNAITVSSAGAKQKKKNQMQQWIIIIIFALFTAIVASGVGLYYFFNAIFTIIQSLIIHKIIIYKRNQRKQTIEDISIFDRHK